MKVYLDNNVVCAIAKDDIKSESAALTRLLEASEKAKVEVVTSEITLDEIKKCPEQYRPPLERTFRLLAKVPIVRWDELMSVSSGGDGLGWVNVPLIHNDTLYDSLLALGLETIDAKHIFVGTKQKCGFFLTCDDTRHTSILRRAKDIEHLCGMAIQKPSESIASQGW